MNVLVASFISIGSIEPQFYALLRDHARASRTTCFDAHQIDRDAMAGVEGKSWSEVFKTKSRDQWCTTHGRHRHLLRADPDHAGSSQASAHGRARNVS